MLCKIAKLYLGQTANNARNPRHSKHYPFSIFRIGNPDWLHYGNVPIQAYAREDEAGEIETENAKKGHEPTHPISCVP